MLVEQVMTSPVTTVTRNTPVGEAWALLQDGRFRHLPVVEDRTVVGIVSDRDLQLAIARAGGDTDAAPSIEAIMWRGVATTTPSTPVADACRLMAEEKVGALPVLDAGALVGIVSESDLLNALGRLMATADPSPRVPERTLESGGLDATAGTEGHAIRKTIVVALDGSELAEDAVPYAAEIARVMGARLILLHVRSDDPKVAAIDAVIELDELADRLRSAGVAAEERVYLAEYESAGMGICDFARELRPDLLVMSTHGRGELGRWLHGSVAQEVLRQGSTPVLLIPPDAVRFRAGDGTFRVLLPLDGSEFAERAIGRAADLIDTLGAELTLLSVVDDTATTENDQEALPYVVIGAGTGQETHGRLQVGPPSSMELATRYLKGVAVSLESPGKSIETVVRIGDPARTIAEVARERRAGMILMATHARTGLARIVLGSIARDVLERARVPLLLVRPDEMALQPATTPSGRVGAAGA
jgi:nucleotide-binding universal stress UspA family protein/predicted transcriptional regulator